MTPALSLVAHRGDRARYPENTLPAMEAAIAVGSRYLEFDVQISADGVPVLIHDATLERTAGRAGNVLEMTARDLATVNVGEPQRFPGKFADVFVPSLADVAARLNKAPDVTVFVEAKRQSIEHHGAGLVLDAIGEALSEARFHWVLISFQADAVSAACRRDWRTGWVLRQFDDTGRHWAKEMTPDYLFVSALRLPAAPATPWAGPWQWVVYDVNTPRLALGLSSRGVELLETDDLLALASHPDLAGGLNDP